MILLFYCTCYRDEFIKICWYHHTQFIRWHC